MSNIIKSPNVKLKLDNAYTIVHEYKKEVKKSEKPKNKNIEIKTLEVQLKNQEQKLKKEREKLYQEIESLKVNTMDELNNRSKLVAEESRKQGYQVGLQQAKEEYESKKQQAEQILNETLKQKEEMIQKLEPKIVKLIENIAKKIIHSEMKFNDDAIVYLIKSGLSEMKSKKNIVIKVSSDDYELVNSKTDILLDSLDSECKLDIVKDSTLKLGGCVIETDYGAIDCSVDKQLLKLAKELTLLYGDEDE